MACPKCGCKEVHQLDVEFDDMDGPPDERLQRCAACNLVFDLDDHEPEDDEE